MNEVFTNAARPAKRYKLAAKGYNLPAKDAKIQPKLKFVLIKCSSFSLSLSPHFSISIMVIVCSMLVFMVEKICIAICLNIFSSTILVAMPCKSHLLSKNGEKLSEIIFSGDTAPPSGCSQYLTGTSGSFYSLNYGGNQHLAGLDYKCFVLFDIIFNIIINITIINLDAIISIYSVLIITMIISSSK